MFLPQLIVGILFLNHLAFAQQPSLDLASAEPSSTTEASASEPPIVGDTAKIGDLRAELEANELVNQIHGSLQQLTETEHIRQQVLNAIRDQTFVHTGFVDDGDDDSPSPPKDATPFTFPKFDLINFLVGHAEKTNQVAAVAGADNLGSSADPSAGEDKIRNFLRSSLEVVAKLPADQEIEGLNANVIDSEFVNHLMGKSENAVAISKHQNRENLHLVSIHEDPTFTLGNNVNTWHTQSCMSGKYHALLGVTDRSLLLVLENNGTYERKQELLLNTAIFTSTTFIKWNGKDMDGFAVLAVDNEIQFVQIWTESPRIEMIWKWNVLRVVKVILYFQIEGKDSLLLVNSMDSNNETHYSADIYSFDLNTRQTWLVQKIPLAYPAANAHFMEMGRQYVLVFPQKGSVEVFRYSRGSDVNQKFVHLKSIESPNVKAVACFQIGGLSYIAVGGRRPQILRYHRQQFYSQTILSTSWGKVEHILPIAARTYRDDLILLVQHRVKFDGGHSVPALEALIWNGEAFVTAALSVPCYYKGVIFESGITCVLDSDRDVGIEGASVIQRGNNISILVPRSEAPSGLYFLAFRLDPVDNPVVSQEQHTSFDLLQKFNAQTDVISAAETVLLNSVDSPTRFTVDWTVGDLESTVVQIDDLSQLTNNEFWLGDTRVTAADLEADVPAMLGLLEQYAKEVAELEREVLDSPSVSFQSPGNGQFKMDGLRLLRERREDKEKLSKFTVKNLHVEYINDIPVNDFVFADHNGDIDLTDSDVFIDSEMEVEGDINVANKGSDQLGDAIEGSTTNLHVVGNLSIGTINGQDFNDLIRNMVLVNVPNSLNNVVVDGTVQFENSLDIVTLNRNPFPSGYLWNSTDRDLTKITGKKVFTGQLHSLEIDNAGLLDGINTRDVVTLFDSQSINGVTTFEHLEVTENLDVTGKVSGRHLDDFLANPNLLQTKVIATDCSFNTLIVEGPVVVANTMQGVNLDAILSDVVYTNETRSHINSIKTFDTLEVDQLQLSAGVINGVSVDDFITLSTEQELSLNRLSGNVIFKELQLDGLFEFINVTELERNAIRLQGDQFTEAELIFENPKGLGNDLEANNLNVKYTFNGVPLDKLVSLNDPLEIVANVELEGAIMVNLNHEEGDMIGLGVLNDYALGDLNRTRVSLSRRQEITAPYFIRKVTIRGDLSAMQVNGVSVVGIQHHVLTVQKVTQDLSSGNMVVQKLFVDGSVTVGQINGHDFESIQSNAIWLDRPNTIGGLLVFDMPVSVSGQFQVDFVKDVQFSDFAAGVVRRNEKGHIEFVQPMTFVNGVQVLQNVQAVRIGEVDGGNIFNRNTNNVKVLKVIGNVSVETVSVAGILNGVTMQDFSNSYVFDELRQTHVVRTSNLRFLEPVVANEIWLHQENPNITAFLGTVVRKDRSAVIKGTKEFQGHIQFLHELQVNFLNGNDLNGFLNTVILNELGVSATISGDISFENRFRGSSLVVHGDVNTDQLMGEKWPIWLLEGVRIDQPWSMTDTIHFGPGAFRADNIITLYVNEIPIADIITTNTEQNFTASPLFSSIFTVGNVHVGGLVNNVNLQVERDNTVMTLGDFHIAADTRFQSIRVMRTLETNGLINNRNLSLIASLNADLTLIGAFSFGQLNAGELRTKEPISGIEFTHWAENSLQIQKHHQVIEGHWTINHLEAQSVSGSVTINGTKVNDLSQRILGVSQSIEENKQVAQHEHQAICNSLDGVLKKSQNFKYSLDHFEEAFKVGIEQNQQLNSFLVWQWENDMYLVVSSGCMSKFHVWDSTNGVFVLRQQVETGVVEEWLSSDGGVDRSIVSNSGMLNISCTNSGMNLWQFINNTVQHVKQIGDPAEKYRLNLNQQPFRDFFFALNSKTRTVTEFDVFGIAVDMWHLPSPQEDCEDVGFVFLPDRITTELALSDGVHLSRLSPNRNSSSVRPKRFFERQIAESFEKLGQTIKRNQEAGGPFSGLFSPSNISGPNFTSAEIKLKLFPAEDPQISWAGNPSTWQSQNPNTLLGTYRQTNPDSTTAEPIKDHDSVGSEKTDDPQRTSLYTKTTLLKNIGIQNPEEVIMAPPPAIYNEDDTTTKNATTTRPKIHQVIVSNFENKDNIQTNGTQPRIDLFGIIEKEAKKASDRIFDNAFGRPANSPDDDTNDDIETQAIENEKRVNHHNQTSMMENDLVTKKPETDIFSLSNKDFRSGHQTTSDSTGIESDKVNIPNDDSAGFESTTEGLDNKVKQSTVAPNHFNSEPDVEIQINSTETRTEDVNITMENSITFESSTHGLNSEISESSVSPIVEIDSTAGPDPAIEISTEDPSSQTDTLTSTLTKTENSQSNIDPNAEPTPPAVGGVLDIIKNVVNIVKEVPEIVHELREDIKLRHEQDDLESHYRMFNQQRQYHDENSLFRNDYLGNAEPSTDTPEANIGVAVLTEGGVSTTENRFLPGRIDGAEIITLEVGADHRRTLVAISHWQTDTVKGHQDVIKIYEDVIDGLIFQTIACHRPRSLTAMRLRTETVLAFVERDAELRVFVYRGIEGFVPFTQFTVDQPVRRFATVALPAVAVHTCPRHFLVVQLGKELRFVEAIMSGYCGFELALDCEG